MSRFPIDWPDQGPINTSLHDLPHASADTEWWYVNSHFTVADGRELSLFAAFFASSLLGMRRLDCPSTRIQ